MSLRENRRRFRTACRTFVRSTFARIGIPSDEPTDRDTEEERRRHTE